MPEHPTGNGQRPNCGPPAGTRPEDITTWPRCGECRACEVERKIASGEIELFDTRKHGASLTGIPVQRNRYLDRGQTLMLDGRLVVGTGLLRGVAYTAPGTVERGYLLHYEGRSAVLLDAVTGRVVAVPDDDCIEVDPRYRGDWTRSEVLLHG